MHRAAKRSPVHRSKSFLLIVDSFFILFQSLFFVALLTFFGALLTFFGALLTFSGALLTFFGALLTFFGALLTFLKSGSTPAFMLFNHFTTPKKNLPLHFSLKNMILKSKGILPSTIRPHSKKAPIPEKPV